MTEIILYRNEDYRLNNKTKTVTRYKTDIKQVYMHRDRLD